MINIEFKDPKAEKELIHIKVEKDLAKKIKSEKAKHGITYSIFFSKIVESYFELKEKKAVV